MPHAPDLPPGPDTGPLAPAVVPHAPDLPPGPRSGIRVQHPVMGTVVSFDVRPGDASRARVMVALARARSRLDRADAVFSLWKPRSPLSRLRRGEATLDQMPAEVAVVLSACKLARTRSSGWFDPWAMPGGVDPTGLVKGWATDLALAELVAAGVASALVAAGGDIATFGGPEPGEPWRIGIQDPWSSDGLVCVVESPGAVATSGTYERGDHVIDPTTGRPGTRCASATVTGPDLAMADALATGLLVAGRGGLEAVAAVSGFEAMVIDEAGMAETGGFARVEV